MQELDDKGNPIGDAEEEDEEEEPEEAQEEEAEEPAPPMQLRCVLQIYNVGEGCFSRPLG